MLLAAGVGLLAAGAAAQDSKTAALFGQKAADPDLMKLDYRLVAALQTAKSGTRSVALQELLPAPAWLATEDGLMLEVLLNAVHPDTASRLDLPGLRVHEVIPAFKRASVELLDPAALQALAQLPDVRRVDPAGGYDTFVGAVTSRATTAMNTPFVVEAFGLTGLDQKVGILSDSFARTEGVRIFTPRFDEEDQQTEQPTTPGAGVAGNLQGARNQNSGDLPPMIELLDDGALGSLIDEGAAMGELIYDIAPRTDMSFHTAFGGEGVFAQGIRDLADAGSSVIVDDVIYFTEPMYQPGVIAQAAQDVVGRGIPFFSAAGNGANRGLRVLFQDSNPDLDDEAYPPTGADLHQWTNDSPFLPITVFPGSTVTVVLQWNQPFDSVSEGRGSQIDLDLYLAFDPTVAALAPNEDEPTSFFSIDRQGTTGSPEGDALEIIGLGNAGTVPLTAYIAVEHYRGRQDYIPQNPNLPLEMRLVVFGSFFQIEGIAGDEAANGGPTLFGHAVAPGIISVGAVPWYDTPAFDTTFGATNAMDAQDFTGTGGEIPFYFDAAGNVAASFVRKPDIAAPNGNNTTFFPNASADLFLDGYQGEPDGFPNFFGTSASAPNAAAVALLIKEADPDISPSELQDILQATAVDVTGRRAAPGWDNTTGWGLVDATAALTELYRRRGIANPTATPTPAPPQPGTGTPTPTPLPSEPGATPTPFPDPQQRLVFDFSNDADERWQFQTVDADAFSPAFGELTGGALRGEYRGNNNSFGFFRSPVFRAGAAVGAGEIGLLGTTGSESLYRATYTVRTNVEQQNQSPTLRFRASTFDFNQTSELTISSNGQDTSLPPVAGTTKAYHHYFGLPPGKDRFRLYIDLLGFETSNAPNAVVFIDEVIVDSFGVPVLGFGQQARTYNLRENVAGWLPPTKIDGFSVPAFRAQPDGIRLGPAANPADGEADFFGFWRTPEEDPNRVRMQQDRLYRVRFRVTSSATEDQRDALPTFRLRVNDSSLNMTSLLHLNSSSPSSYVPAGGEVLDYLLFFEGREELDQRSLYLAFDYLLTQDLGNDDTIVITLQEVQVDTFAKPVF